MKRKAIFIGAAAAVLGALMLPATAFADAAADQAAARFDLDTLWIFIAAVLVIFMQAGFAFLEIGFSRGKNAGTIIAKILTNFSIAAVCYWAVGYAFAWGSVNDGAGIDQLIGTSNFFLSDLTSTQGGDGISGYVDWLFQFAFCAVSLAIVWGTTLERIKFGVYIIYAIVFSAFIYPVASHWIWAGGWLGAHVPIQDFAGSTVVHLIGATGGLAAVLLLGPRRGKYVDGKVRAIPGHNMPLFGLACFILLIGWFGFNPGSGLSAGYRLAEIGVVTLIGGAAGVIGALIVGLLKQRTIDIGMVGNGLIAGLVAITAPSGYVYAWAALPIGLAAGAIVVLGVIFIDSKLKIDDPVGALSAHGLAGIWGTLSCGIFTAPELAASIGVGSGGLWYNGDFAQLGNQALGVLVAFTFVFAMSYATFAAIKATYGLRVSAEEEDAGLDIVEHGMYGYPEQFIPASELVGSGLPGSPSHASVALTGKTTTATEPAGSMA